MITVQWDEAEKMVLRLDYVEPIASWEEYDEAVKEAYALAKSQNQPVYFLHNPGKARMPAGNAIAHIRRAIHTSPRNTASVLMVISDDFARRILQVVIKIAGKSGHFYIVGTLEEAYRVIAIQREQAMSSLAQEF